jgi:hypothetical protein
VIALGRRVDCLTGVRVVTSAAFVIAGGGSVNREMTLDFRLMRAMRGGANALPADLKQLRDYLGTITVLLAEKAAELEPSWEQACAAAAEIATLQDLETSVAERAIAVRAECLTDVRAKLAIWRALAPGSEEGDLRGARSRLILSVEADLERLALANPR